MLCCASPDPHFTTAGWAKDVSSGFLPSRLCYIGNNVNNQAKLHVDKQPHAWVELAWLILEGKAVALGGSPILG